MREFSTDGKHNFVDTNDVLVGFDINQNCCENFGWLYTETYPIVINQYIQGKPPFDLEQFSFDKSFFERGGEHVVFKLISDQKQVYLVLYNEQNGYYSHGFHMDVGGKTIREEGV